VFAWVGGAVFVAALAACGYFYAVVLARPVDAAEGGTAAVLWNAALFSGFAAHHSIMARTGAKAWFARHLPAPIERSVYVWVSSALLVAVCWWWRPVPGLAWSIDGPLRLGLYAVQCAGVVLSGSGAAVIDALELAGIRQASGDTRPVRFRIVGPFTLVRHPIYLGWVLIVCGAPLMTASRLVFAVVSSAYLVLAIPFEERSLEAAFGDEYRAYQRRVPSRLLPLVW
jgi:protein-S-isoprenylcysteine O-methyltransferase Ste14